MFDISDLISIAMLTFFVGGFVGWFFGGWFRETELKHPELWEDDSE